VAALLQDLEHVEITAKVIGKAIGDLGSRRLHSSDAHTFQGSDLVHSLGTVLTGALPLLMTDNPSFGTDLASGTRKPSAAPFGARIIQTVRAYDSLVFGQENAPRTSPQKAMEELRADLEVEHHPAVLFALDQVLLVQPSGQSKIEPAQELVEI
jgi:response regulator RpfG family c-di-GMP phosphodiesterase